MTVGLGARTSTFSDTFSIAPQSMVALSFDKKAIQKFYQGSLKATDKDVIVFNKGDGTLISFAHEFGGGTGSKGPGLRFSMRIVDQDNYFLNSLFSSRYEDYIARTKNALTDELKEEAKDAAKETRAEQKNSQNPNTIVQSYDLLYEQEVSERLRRAVKTNTNFYVTYGIGPNNQYWAGPFLCTLSNGVYEEQDGLVIFNLEFVGSKSIRSVDQTLTNSPQAASVTSEDILFAEVDWDIENDINIEFNPLYKTVHLAVEPLINNYCKNVLGYSNVLLCYRDFGIGAHYYTPVTGRQSTVESVSSIQEFEFLGIQATGSLSEQNIYRGQGLAGGTYTVELNRVDFAPNNDFIEVTDASYPGTRRTNDISIKLTADGSNPDDAFRPIVNLLSNISDLPNIEELVDPVAVLENDVEIVQHIYDTYNGILPGYITDPNQPVLIIGENALIQHVIYGKPVADESLISEKMVGPENTVVKKVYNTRDKNKTFFQSRKDRRPYVSIFDEEAPVVPEDFALPQEVSNKIREFNIPVFRMNTQNANVLSLTANSDAFLISTIGQVSRQLMISATRNASQTQANLLHSQKQANQMISKIVGYLSKAYQLSNVNNAYSVLSNAIVGDPDFQSMAGDLANLILAPDSALVGPNPLTTGTSSSSLIAYLYNFFKLFSSQHTAIIRTVPHFNFSDTSLLGDNCILFKNINRSLMGDPSVTNSIYTGVWVITGFKHVISGDDAYSEFSIIKKPFSMEAAN